MQKIYENDDFIIVAKPASIEFHGDDGVLASLRLDNSSLFGIHRLDKETSGLMVFAKSKQVQSDISKLFEMKKVSKYYIALSKSKPNKKMGTITGDLEKGRGGSYYLRSTLNNPSKTIFISAHEPESKLRIFILKPFTGKTHQLRVVMKSLGAPIFGDGRYGANTTEVSSDRMYLHAFYLSFTYKDEFYSFNFYPDTGSSFLDINIKKATQALCCSEMTKKIFKESSLNKLEFN